MAEIQGTPNPDTIQPGSVSSGVTGGTPTAEADTIFGYAGGDTVYGGAGGDSVDGGEGSDRLYGEEGNDTLLGGAGTDRLYGGDGDDVLDQGPSRNDRLYGDSGNDYFYSGDDRAKIIEGGPGDDTLDYSRSLNNNNVVHLERNFLLDGYWRVNSAQRTFTELTNVENIIGGDIGRDDMVGTNGVDKFWGMGGNDQIYGKGGDDEIYGGLGNDRLIGGAGRDYLHGNLGLDTVDYFYATSGRLIDLGRDSTSSPGFSRKADGSDDGDTDTLLSIERVRGSNFDDIIKGGLNSRVWDNVLRGGEGDDEIWGRRGDNELYGDGGNDTFKVDRISSNSWGETRIKDWGIGEDVIDLSDWRSGSDPRDINISYGSRDTTITISGAGVTGFSMVVENTKSEHFDLSDLDSGLIRAKGMNVEVLANPLPSYEWYYGCSPTSMASIIAYWDLNGYPDMYKGIQGWDQVSVMQNVKDQVMSPEHIAKYAYYSYLDNPDAPDFAPNSIATFARSGFGDERHHTSTSTGGTRDGLDDYAAYRGYDFNVSRVKMAGADQDAIWERLVSEIEAGRPALAYLATSSDPNHYVPIFGVAELPGGNRWYNHYNHSSTVSTVEGEYETPVWHEFKENVISSETEEGAVTTVNVAWGIHTMFFVKPANVTLTGNDGGSDTLVAGGGDDRLYGYGGNDALNGGIGHDRLYGGSGNDTLNGGIGNDYLSASSGDDTVYGDAGNDTLYGSRGDDLVDGGTGNDTLTGGSSNDIFVFGEGYGEDIITDFGEGADRIDARGTGFDTLADFNALAGANDRVDGGDSYAGIGVSATGSDLVLDFGNGDILTVLNSTGLGETDFILA